MKSELEYYKGNWNANDEKKWQKKCGNRCCLFLLISVISFIILVFSIAVVELPKVAAVSLFAFVISGGISLVWLGESLSHGNWGKWGGI